MTKGIGALIGIIIAIIVGVALISPVGKTVSTITDATTTTITTAIVQGTTTTGIVTTPAYADSIKGIAGILPIIFVATILLIAIKVMGEGGLSFSFSGSSEEKEEKQKNKKERQVTVTIRTNSGKTISIVEKASNGLESYINNLDELIGIKTRNQYAPLPAYSLSLESNILSINDYEYDWYITAKQPNENVFKVIGLNKTDEANNVVYILGNRNDKPFLIKVPVTRVADEVASPKELFAGYYTE